MWGFDGGGCGLGNGCSCWNFGLLVLNVTGGEDKKRMMVRSKLADVGSTLHTLRAKRCLALV